MFLFVFLLFFFISSILGDDDCVFEPSGAKKIYLKYAAAEEAYKVSDGGYVYYINICENTNIKCDGASYPAVKAAGGTCERYYGTQSSREISLLDNSNPEEGVQVWYKNGEIDLVGGATFTTNTYINIVCDKEYDTEEKMQKSLKYTGPSREPTTQQEYFSFHMSSKYACPGQKKGLTYPLGKIYGFGGLFMTLALIALIIYIIVAFVIQILVRKKRGWDMIPHRKFLLDFPKLVWEGMRLIFEFSVIGFKFGKRKFIQIKGKIGKGGGSPNVGYGSDGF